MSRAEVAANVVEVGREKLGGLEIVSVTIAEGSDEGLVLILERGLNPSDSDVRHGFDRHSLTDGHGCTEYGAVESVAWEDRRLGLAIHPPAAERMDLPSSLYVEFTQHVGDLTAMRVALNEILETPPEPS